MRKTKKALVEMPPPQAPPPSFQMRGEDGKAKLKHQVLMQDYEDLLKETDSIHKILHSRKKRKLKLMSEVRFLRRKYKSLLKNSSQDVSFSSKNQSHCSSSSMETFSRQFLPPKFDIQTQNPDAVKQLQPANEKNYRDKEPARPSRPLVLDLNQASVPNDEEAELQVAWDTMKMEKPLKQHPMEADPISSDLRLSLCRDIGNGTSRTGKRKISWQDPVALRV